MAIINGNAGNNVLQGTGDGDTINGYNGDDLILAGGGADTVAGGNGNDTILGEAGSDTLNGDAGADRIYGGEGNDKIVGGTGNDSLYGEAGADSLLGGDGDDVLDGGSGADKLTGGAGADQFVFSGSFGSDIVTDFAIGEDSVLFDNDTAGATWAQVGNDAVLTLTNGRSVTFQNQTVGAMDDVVPCLLRGTMVRTPSGEVPVESLAISDLVLTIDGKAEELKWIGRRAYARAFAEGNEKVMPILFEPGSLGVNAPSRDLYVSPEHAVLVEHALVPAGLLVNGASIRRVDSFETVEYFHLEFDRPEVVFTDGAATESYVNHDNRRMFQNFQEYVDLYGDEGISENRERRFEAVEGGAELVAIQQKLAKKAQAAA